MDKKAVISFSVFLLLCSTSLDSFAAVKTDRQNTNMQMMPGEVYTAMQRLADQGIVRLPAGCRNVRDANFDRHEMSLLTLQAMKRIGMDENGMVAREDKENLTGYADTLYLKEALTLDLTNLGMNQEHLMKDLSPSSEAGEAKVNERRKFAIHGEIRYTTNEIQVIKDGTGMTAGCAHGSFWKRASMITGMRLVCWKLTSIF